MSWLFDWVSVTLGVGDYRSGSLKLSRSEFTSILKDVEITLSADKKEPEESELDEHIANNEWGVFHSALITRCGDDKTYVHMLRALCLHKVVYESGDEGIRISFSNLILRSQQSFKVFGLCEY